MLIITAIACACFVAALWVVQALVLVAPYFGGAATTALVALQHGRRAILCELNPEYVALQRKRLEVFDADTSSPIAPARTDFGPLFGGAA